MKPFVQKTEVIFINEILRAVNIFFIFPEYITGLA
jgi:hypothetical protein